jgi:hypothetical protein
MCLVFIELNWNCPFNVADGTMWKFLEASKGDFNLNIERQSRNGAKSKIHLENIAYSLVDLPKSSIYTKVQICLITLSFWDSISFQPGSKQMNNVKQSLLSAIKVSLQNDENTAPMQERLLASYVCSIRMSEHNNSQEIYPSPWAILQTCQDFYNNRQTQLQATISSHIRKSQNLELIVHFLNTCNMTILLRRLLSIILWWWQHHKHWHKWVTLYTCNNLQFVTNGPKRCISNPRSNPVAFCSVQMHKQFHQSSVGDRNSTEQEMKTTRALRWQTGKFG